MRFTAETRGCLKCKISPGLTHDWPTIDSWTVNWTQQKNFVNDNQPLWNIIFQRLLASPAMFTGYRSNFRLVEKFTRTLRSHGTVEPGWILTFVRGFTICPYVERYFSKSKIESPNWVTKHPCKRALTSILAFKSSYVQRGSVWAEHLTVWIFDRCVNIAQRGLVGKGEGA